MISLKGKKLGYASALTAVSIWAVFLLGTRFAVSGNFKVEEVLLLRLMTAAIVTIPIMIKLGVVLRGKGFLGTLILTLGGSAIFLGLLFSLLLSYFHISLPKVYITRQCQTLAHLHLEHYHFGPLCLPF